MRPSKSLLPALVALAFPFLAQAQQAPVEFRISKIEPAFVETPDLSAGYSKKSRTKVGPWLEVEVTFDYAPATKESPLYVDDLTVNYFILLNNKSPENPQGVLLTGSVDLTNVQYGKDMKTVAYVSPRSLARLFPEGKMPGLVNQAVAGIGVTLTRGGQVVAEATTEGRGQWWTEFKGTNGFVMSKQDTPFAPLAWDYFQSEKLR